MSLLMCDAVAWLREFQENVANEEFLRERVNLPCWIHLSEARLDRLLALIDRKTGRVGVAKQGWPRVVANYSGTVRGDCLFGVLQLGLSDEAYADDVLDVVIELVSRPPQRVYVEPLLEETLFILKCKESPKLAILEYYLSYKWSIDRGLVKWEDAQKEYNDFVLEFQKGVYEIAPDSELVTASVSMLSSIEFVEESCAKLGDREFELVKEMVGIARDEDRVMSTMALFRALSGPVDQRQNLKGQYIPVALPPADVLVPRLGRFAYSLEDAAVRLFLSKRYDIARDVVELIESVCANLNQSNEVRYDSRAVPMRLRPVGVSVEGYPQNTCVSVAYDHVFLNYGFHPFEKGDIFEGCMPIEIMAKRGIDTLRFGPLKPVGFDDPRTCKRPYAIVQLRQDNSKASLYNLVGFQTNLKYGEQKRVFSMIPGLENSDFIKYGVMHRNTFINSTKLLDSTFQLKKKQNVFLAGQITGVEGYVESIASGLVAGINTVNLLENKEKIIFPKETMIGALSSYISTNNDKFQPMNANFGILPELDGKKIKDKKLRYEELSKRALQILKIY